MELVIQDGDNKFTLCICDDHQHILKSTVEMYGLEDFIAKSEAQAVSLIERAILEDFIDPEDSFEPLLMMMFYLWKKSLDFQIETGINLSDKETCIICEYDNFGNADKWIDESISHTLLAAKELGLYSVQ